MKNQCNNLQKSIIDGINKYYQYELKLKFNNLLTEEKENTSNQ